MGCCASSEQRQTTTENNENEVKKDETNKLLFLGPGGCGKSTLFKQLRQTFGSSFDKTERELLGEHIHTYVIETVSYVVSLIDDRSKFSKEVQDAIEYMESLKVRTILAENTIAHIKILWNDPTFKAIFEEEVSNEAEVYTFFFTLVFFYRKSKPIDKKKKRQR
ncbi:hypothetical protein RFI_12052 [Reticulomyxa filosa]|uniref:Uncharacterized protein n=1 Tax=Reticulomyxa filosa TaxID=46433 RepID=X6NIB3_RETFI|nr:hypothetical protein RFI_12052 [Reticulomyxa filosa]|eukprot:ETO25092.1 hypothetical protein RFI_12052 [Reticulomyxa filosa]